MLLAVRPKLSTRSSAWPAPTSGGSDSAMRHSRSSSRLTRKSLIAEQCSHGWANRANPKHRGPPSFDSRSDTLVLPCDQDWSVMNKQLSVEEAAELYGNRFLTEDAPDGPFPEIGMSALDAMRLVDEELA